MNKTNFFKMVMTLVMAFMVTGAFAQLNDPAGDYNSENTQATHKVTVGTTMPFWVEPDSYFNPSFESTVNALADGVAVQEYMDDADKTEVVSTFAWDISELTPYTPAVVRENYVEIEFSTTNGFVAGTDYTITVSETASGCPGTAVDMVVSVVAQPTMSWVTADQDACSPVTSAITANITGDVDDGDMTLFWSFSASNVDSDWDGAFPVDAAYNEVDITGAAATAEGVTDYDIATGTAQTFATTGNQDLITSQDWDAMNNAITIYTFTLEGVTDKVSRKSDYLSVYNAVDLNDETIYTQYGTSDVVRIIVRPAPVTGPIYHISNNWGL